MPATEPARSGLGRLGGFELLEELGRGGAGVVYRARQTSLGREVALKVLRSGPWADPKERQRFRREAAAVAALRHPNIVAVHEIGEQDGHEYLAMELLSGGTLADRTHSGPLVPGEATRLGLAVAEAVAAAHAAGVVHRDLKPANVLLDASGQPRVADFGLAKRMDETEDESTRTTLSGQVFGSPGYLPPEQADPARGPVSFPADVYALGGLLYHLLTGRPPFSAASVAETLRGVLHEEVVAPRRLNPAVSVDLETVCLKCLRKEPARRYASAAAVAEDLRAVLERRPITARAVGTPERVLMWCRRRPTLATLSGGLLAMVLVGLLAFLGQARANRRQLYAADLRLASQAIEEGNLGRARELLRDHQPGVGDRGDFVWRWLMQRAEGDPRRLLGLHPWIVNAVAWSPDGRYLASASVGSGTVGADVRLWEPDQTNTTARIVSDQGAREMAWFPDGQRLLVVQPEGQWVVLSVPEGTVIRRQPGRSASLSRDGRWLVVCQGSPYFWDEPPAAGRVSVLDMEDVHAAERDFGEGRLVAISADGSRVAVSDLQSEIRVVSVADARVLVRLSLQQPLWALAFSPDATWLVGTGPGEDVQVWSTEARSGLVKPAFLRGHRRSTWRAAFTWDGTRLVTTSSDQTLRFWAVGSWEALGSLSGHGSEVWCAAFDPRGERVASGSKDRAVMLWNLPRAPADESVEAAGYSPVVVAATGDPVATVSGKDPSVTLVHRFGGNSAPRSPHRISDSRPVRWIDGGQALQGWDSSFGLSEIDVTHPTEPRKRLELEHEPGEPAPYDLRAADLGSVVAGLAEAGRVSVWSLADGRRLALRVLPTRRPYFVHPSPRGRWLAVTAGEDGFWVGAVTDSKLRPITAHRDVAKWAAISSDERWLATAAVDGVLRLWGLPALEEVAELRGHPSEVSCVAFGPDGETLVSSEEGAGLRFWNLATRREIAAMALPEVIPGLAFSGDGSALCVSLSQGRARVLRAPSNAHR